MSQINVIAIKKNAIVKMKIEKQKTMDTDFKVSVTLEKKIPKSDNQLL